MRRAAILGPAVVLAVLGCATARLPLDQPSGDAAASHAPPRELAVAGLYAWVLRGDSATAARRLELAVQRDGADPWARMGSALLARRRLDEGAEVAHLSALVAGAPDHPLVLVAARRLGELAELAPPLARAVEDGLAKAQPRLRGLAAARVRLARALAAAAQGQHDRAQALRAENGTVTAFTLAGPFGALHALEIDTPFAPEEGRLPASTPAAAGLPPVPARTLPCPEGAAVLDGEPTDADIFYFAADAAVARGGAYLLALGGTATLRVFLDGDPVVERRAYAAFLPVAQVVALTLAPGPHHLLVKVGRGGGRAQIGASIFRQDGSPSDVTFSPTPAGGALPIARAGQLPPAVDLARDLAARLEPEVGPVVARLVAAREAMDGDRETAKALLDEALRSAPESNALQALRGEVLRDDPTLGDRIARARAEGIFDRVLARDPGDAASRVARAELAIASERLDDAAGVLEGLSEADAARPRALVARARLSRARGLSEVAERLADEARRTGGDCAALDLLFGLVARRDAAARQDEVMGALARCPGGPEQLVDHLRRRGDLAGALAIATDSVRRWPDRIGTRLTRSALLAAAGRPREAAEDLGDLARLWPRDPRIEKRRAEYLEAAGDAEGARAAREHALLLDGDDLALRRALALERGHEPLDEVAEDGLRVIASYRAAAPRYTTSGVTVLDFGAIEVHPGGAYTERVHTIIEARDERAVDRVGEVTIPEGAELIVARTIKRDGRILDAEEPLGDKRTLSLTGLERGDFAEWEWIRSVAPRGRAVPGFTADAFLFRGDTPLWRSVYVVTAPAGVDVELDPHHMQEVERRQEGGRTVIRAVRENIPALIAEPNAPGDTEHVPFLQVGSGAAQGALALAMADALSEAFRPTREVLALADEIAAAVPAAEHATEALVRAAYRRVNQVVLGQGGFGDSAAAILARGRGNRTILLKAVLDALGVKSRIALLRDFTRDPAPYRFPRADLYAYAVLRVEHGGRTVWLDPTTRGTPYGVLPNAVRGVEALVLPAPGEDVVVARSPDPGEDEEHVTQLSIALDGDGGATIEGREEFRGFEAAAVRASLEQLDAESRRQGFEQLLSRSFRAPSLVSLEFDGEDELEGSLVVRWRARVDRWTRLEPGRAVVETPVFAARLATRFLQRASRETPLLIGIDERTRLEVAITLPPGWSAVPSPSTEVSGAYGRYERRERVEGPRFVRQDRYQLRRARVSPADYPEFVGFARSVDTAQEQPLVFLRSATVARHPMAGNAQVK